MKIVTTHKKHKKSRIQLNKNKQIKETNKNLENIEILDVIVKKA